MSITASQERELEYIHVAMVREHLTRLPSFPLPAGYRLRYYRRGEDRLWAEVEASVDEFPTVDRALAHFEQEFGPHRRSRPPAGREIQQRAGVEDHASSGHSPASIGSSGSYPIRILRITGCGRSRSETRCGTRSATGRPLRQINTLSPDFSISARTADNCVLAACTLSVFTLPDYAP